MEFDEKNTSKLAKLETDLGREMSKTEKLRAEIAALKASMEKSNSNVKGRRGKKKNLTTEYSPTTKRSTTTSRPKVSKTMTSTTKKPVLKFAYRLLGQNQEKYRLRNSSSVVFS